MTRYNKLVELFPTFVGDIEVYYNYNEDGDSDTLDWIDVPENRCKYRYTVQAECGCCTTSEYDYDRLDCEIDSMADSEFEDLIKELNRLTNK